MKWEKYKVIILWFYNKIIEWNLVMNIFYYYKMIFEKESFIV